MKELISEAATIGAGNDEKMLVLALHKDNYITSGFLNHAKSVTKNVIHLIDKMAMVGLTKPQRIILKGYCLFFQRNFKSFETKQQATDYLLGKVTPDDERLSHKVGPAN